MTERQQLRSYDPISEVSSTSITPVEYSGLQMAYDHFNEVLFDGKLVDCFITYQRHAHSAGYFAPDRFAGRDVAFGRHELALNPDGFIGRTDEQITSTLVHEMVHVWQQQYGKPSSRGYHNKQWAAQMKAVGLQPSSTGMVGGRETGQRMSHYIIAGGAFEQSYDRLAASNWRLNLESAHRPGEQRKPNDSKTKFTCPMCGRNVWGKPDTMVLCLPCFEDCTADGNIEFARHALMLPAKDVAKANALALSYEREEA